MELHTENAMGELGSVIGKGLLAGLVGTAAITLSQMIEMKLTKREPSEAPVRVVKKTLGAKPASQEEKPKMTKEVHWAYGTTWGIARGLIGLTGLKGLPAALVHFGAVWGASMIILPKFNAAPPITEQKPKAIIIDGIHHAVYAMTAGFTYDALDSGNKAERKYRSIVKKLHWAGLLKKIG